jgi:hypothetical protein
MKHAYEMTCKCARCGRERVRRGAQGNTDPRRVVNGRRLLDAAQAKARRALRRGSRRPAFGSAEWAETRGDDVPSLDQPGDSFDMPGGDW